MTPLRSLPRRRNGPGARAVSASSSDSGSTQLRPPLDRRGPLGSCTAPAHLASTPHCKAGALLARPGQPEYDRMPLSAGGRGPGLLHDYGGSLLVVGAHRPRRWQGGGGAPRTPRSCATPPGPAGGEGGRRGRCHCGWLGPGSGGAAAPASSPTRGPRSARAGPGRHWQRRPGRAARPPTPAGPCPITAPRYRGPSGSMPQPATGNAAPVGTSKSRRVPAGSATRSPLSGDLASTQ